MASFTTSSVPANPTLRPSKTLIVIPLLASKHTPRTTPDKTKGNSNTNATNDPNRSYSTESFRTLFSSLAHINLERSHFPSAPPSSSHHRSSASRDHKKEVTLIIPNANLTPPGEWRYDDTSLQSHDWGIGCQRMTFVDGTRSLHAQDRLKAFHKTGSVIHPAHKTSYYGEFTDLYPSRGISAVVGVLNVRDCQSNEDLRRAEQELESWVQKFTPILYAQKYWDEAFDSPMAPKHFVQKRMFVFDGFEEGNTIDLGEANMKPGELVAFPPTENMDLHLNVVVNDLCVSTFMDLERRIRVLDSLSGSGSGSGSGNGGRTDQLNTSGIGDVATIVGVNNSFNDADESDEDDTESTTVAGTATGSGETTSEKAAGASSSSSVSVSSSSTKKKGFRGLAANAVKALNNRNTVVTDACAELPPIEHELQTPIDDGFDEANLTTRDIETIFKRNAARRQKHAADLALLAGSAMDAYDRYTKAAEASKKAHDPLWYAAALEGIATSFIAMSDTGGHGADFYLENNFQYPDEIMHAALVVIGNVEDGKDATKIDKSKTTMPRAVYALLEEAFGIFSRHAKLASIASELLLKMAWYTAELEGLHARCRWGEGFSGGDDDLDSAEDHTMTAAINGSQKRWEMTSVSKIDLDLLRSRGKLDAVLSKSAADQCQRFVETLHKASNNGGIDSYTRACVAARCAKLCLKGVRGPFWGRLDLRKGEKRHILPRKAALFTTIAAEAMSQCKAPNAKACAEGFWAAASHLYSMDGNKFDSNNIYAWASLRSTIFHAMSLYGSASSSESAMEKFLLLLGACSAKAKPNTGASSREGKAGRENNQSDDESTPKVLKEENDLGADLAALKTSHARTKSTTLPVRSTFFPHINSGAMLEQSKWVDGDILSPIVLPLIEPSSKVAILNENGDIEFMKKVAKAYNNLSPLIFLNAVITDMDFDVCIAAQMRCIAILSSMRKSIPTKSPSAFLDDGPSGGSLSSATRQSADNPLKIISAQIVKSESHLLDKLKAAGYAKEKGSMSTFFNPYANKKSESLGKNLITLVAQGEERTIMVEFENCLAVPLDIPSCQLVFDKSKSVDVEAPPLSFTLPPKSNKFAVSFPFTVAALNLNLGGNGTSAQQETKEYDDSYFTFGAIGIRVSTFNRSFFIPFDIDSATKATRREGSISTSPQIPNPISTYEPSKKNGKTKTCGSMVSLEAVPAQPNLLISFVNSPTPIDEAAVPVHLSEGEIFTIPAFRLENDFGSSGLGKLERLQIVGVGMPGLPEEILFDTDEVAKALEAEEDRFSDEESENDEFDELFESDGLPPLKMKCLAEGLSLSSINDRSKSLGEGSILSFQVAATHDMGNKIKNGGNVRIRFRYRGPSPITGIEIWRKREVALKIVKVKGPRISSLTFRSDLSWGSAYSDLCHSLASQRDKHGKIPGFETTMPEILVDKGENSSLETNANTLNDITNVLGKDKLLGSLGNANGVFISKDEIVVLMAVANETSSTIVLSNRAGIVGGFESSPMHTVKVSSGVSVKIPVVIPRIGRLDEKGEAIDIANELIAHTALHWQSEVTSDEKDSLQKKARRQGRCRIPKCCLREMIQEHSSFATRICQSPLRIELKVNGAEYTGERLSTIAGFPLNLQVKAGGQEWIPAKSRKSCSSATLVFCCSRKNSGRDSKTHRAENKGAFIWCGQVQKSFQFDDKELKHGARLCFLKPGEFVVSACVKIRRGDNEEIWWAPYFWAVNVSKQES